MCFSPAGRPRSKFDAIDIGPSLEPRKSRRLTKNRGSTRVTEKTTPCTIVCTEQLVCKKYPGRSPRPRPRLRSRRSSPSIHQYNSQRRSRARNTARNPNKMSAKWSTGLCSCLSDCDTCCLSINSLTGQQDRIIQGKSASRFLLAPCISRRARTRPLSSPRVSFSVPAPRARSIRRRTPLPPSPRA